MAKIRIRKTKPKAKAKPKESASPTSKLAFSTDAEKATCAGEHIAAMTGSPSWTLATDVQSASNTWGTVTASLATNEALINTTREALAAAYDVQVGLRIKWVAARRHVLSAVGVFCGGSSALIEGLGFDVLTHTVLDIAVPSSIFTTPGVNPGEVDASWDESVNRHGFMLQHASESDQRGDVLAVHPLHDGDLHARRAGLGGHGVLPRRGHRSLAAHAPDGVEPVDRRDGTLTGRSSS